ncbi:hypothetical protein HG535_0G04130 [Zygotorulaspora mrakii]|uniref:Long chronological lifespan protein 2 n=1 Tax=Zygotorulaspora mrakii TaxID=42260 RepID=A0A7H9B7L3_ZYGMR|nr:uncharacterized protein HG535_0G04130 [Zygotorulaspora mrakii]QLG74530.1 hypothetical protein HG535_0G04130 [Zygotorulaspora mrakii]
MILFGLQEICATLLVMQCAFGFLFNFNPNQQQQQQQQQAQPSFEDIYLNNECNGYLCPDTMQCVSQPKDCPCPFPKSQLKCTLPNDRYICISKPATHDAALNEIYDDETRGSTAKKEEARDCGWVLDAYMDKV